MCVCVGGPRNYYVCVFLGRVQGLIQVSVWGLRTCLPNKLNMCVYEGGERNIKNNSNNRTL